MTQYPIIVNLYLDSNSTTILHRHPYLTLPCDTHIIRHDKGLPIIDIKANGVQVFTGYPDDFRMQLQYDTQYIITISPQTYFAGWSRWFSIGASNQCNVFQNALTRIYSDPDYGHLLSENEIGERFRQRQYYNCQYLTNTATEDIEDKWEIIPISFRRRQYDQCCSIQPPVDITIGDNIKRVNAEYRENQFGFGASIDIYDNIFSCLYDHKNETFWASIWSSLITARHYAYLTKLTRPGVDNIIRGFLTYCFQKTVDKFNNRYSKPSSHEPSSSKYHVICHLKLKCLPPIVISKFESIIADMITNTIAADNENRLSEG